jgi:hypothetical protein
MKSKSFSRLLVDVRHVDGHGSYLEEVVAKASATGLNEEIIPWSDDCSPLLIAFRGDDPDAGEWGLNPAGGHPILIQKGGFLPEADVAVEFPMNWLDAFTIICRARDLGIPEYCNEYGRLNISGFTLHSAGLIDENLEPLCKLTKSERRHYRADDPAALMLRMLRDYADSLIAVIENAEEHHKAQLAEHLHHAVDWLNQHDPDRVQDLEGILLAEVPKKVN